MTTPFSVDGVFAFGFKRFNPIQVLQQPVLGKKMTHLKTLNIIQESKPMNPIKKLLMAAAGLFVASAVVLAQGGIVATGTFHGAAHKTAGRATIYSVDGKQTLRITNFKTSNGPDVHVVLIAATDAQDDENFFDKKVERVELGSLKGNEGDQNYDIPAGTDLDKFKAVAIYCERFNANFGTAPLSK